MLRPEYLKVLEENKGLLFPRMLPRDLWLNQHEIQDFAHVQEYRAARHWEIDTTIYVDNEGGQFNQIAKGVYVGAYWQFYRDMSGVKVNRLEEGETYPF